VHPSTSTLFDKWLKGSRLVGTVHDVRFLAPDVAVMHAVGGTILRGRSKPTPGRDSIQTLVATRHAAEWHFAAFQNTRLRIMGGSRRAFLAWTLSDLTWKVFRAQLRGDVFVSTRIRTRSE
jgi:hypothetical protein